jgi:hypothetical protein
MQSRVEIVSAAISLALCSVLAHEAIAAQPLVGGEFQVNANSTGAQVRPRVALGSDGRFLVSWQEHDTGIFGRVFDAAGNPLTSDFQITNVTSHYTDADALSGGGFIVVWGGTTGQRLDSTGNAVGPAFQIPTTSGYRLSYPAVAGRDDGGFVVAWTNHLSGLDANVYARVFDASGTPAGDDFRVNSYTTEYQGNPSVDSLADGGFVVVWASRGQDNSFMSIFGQRYDSSGSPAGSEFAVKATPADLEFWTEVKGTPDGGFVVVWMYEDLIQDIGSGISARKFDAAGLPVGVDFQVSSSTLNGLPAVGVAADNSFVIAWAGNEDLSDRVHIFGRRFQPDTTPIGPSFPLSSFRTTLQTEPEVAILPTGDFVSVWQTVASDGDRDGVFGAFGCVGDGTDSDGDGIGDACDACTDASPAYIDTSAKLNFRFVNLESSFSPNDSVQLRGQAALSPGFGFQDIDPLAVPVRLRLENSVGAALVDVTFPTSAFSNGGAGWVRNGPGTRWSFRDKSGDPVNGIVAFKLTAKSGGVQVSAKGRNGLYGIDPSEEVAEAIVTFGDALNGECAATNFVAADCTFDGLGVGFRCIK